MWESHLSDWLELGVRWLHVIAGVVWIGTSFYFNWLNNHVRQSPDSPSGVDAELWAIHGGAFYRVMKYDKPETLPDTLHWFKWEAYTTWMSGFALLVLIFYVDAPLFLIDASKTSLTSLSAALIGTGVLVLGWLFYEELSRSTLIEKPAWYGAISLVLISGVAIGLSAVFTGRGAYIHVGALLGTLMAGNVFFIIIPAQKEMVSAMEQGRDPDPEIGKHAALRSLHNNYLTLPVLFIMVSAHFPFTYGHEWGWAILAGLMVVSVAVRHWFNLRGRGEGNTWLMPTAALGMIVLALVTVPNSDLPFVDPTSVSFDEGVVIIETRCTPCHSSIPTQPGFNAPPKGIIFDTSDQMIAQAALVRKMAVDSETMPLANITEMTDEERAILEVWLDKHTDG
jgi:uncharacterized membrane protein